MQVIKTKTSQVKDLVERKEFKKALIIAKDFRIGVTKEESKAMVLAYECMVHGSFYRSLGYDLEEKINEGIRVLVSFVKGE